MSSSIVSFWFYPPQTPEGSQAPPLHTQQVQEVQQALLGHAGATLETNAAHVGPSNRQPARCRCAGPSGAAVSRNAARPTISPLCPTARFKVLFRSQSQLAKMTSELCDGGADEQREKEAPAASKSSSVSPLSVAASLELPGPWSCPASPVNMPIQCHTVNRGHQLGAHWHQVARQKPLSRLQCCSKIAQFTAFSPKQQRPKLHL